uniref:CSON015492 protein n=1 Tax=Culicoides sonorensis TaxID=179676 RepID=A0A336KEE6_CULSO
MTNRNRNTGKIETTIELFRTDGKWSKVIELAEELRAGSPNNSCLANFLIGEGKLESYLEENPPTEENFFKARTALHDAKQALLSVTGDEGRKAGIALDSHLLLAKLLYCCGNYDESLEHFVSAELNTLAEKALSSRSLRILAESYAIKGLCLENKTGKASSKFKIAEQEQEMISCFEKASDLGLLYLQGQDSGSHNAFTSTGTLTSGSQSSEPRRMGTILETILQRAPIILIKSGKLMEAINRYRCLLQAVETRATQSLRLTLTRQLAEVLLRGVSGQLYVPPTGLSPSKNSTNKRLWEPKRYSQRQQFIPKNLEEETILLLLIAESLAVKDAVLTQSPEVQKERAHSQRQADAVYDIMCLAVARWDQSQFLCESFEKALKFSFREQHVWKQYCLSLASLGRHKLCYRALKEAIPIDTENNFLYLLSARLCFEHLDMVHEGLDCANKALMKEKNLQRPSRAQLYVGIGLIQMASSSHLKSDRDRYNKLALEALEKAVQADSNDHLAEYYQAYYHARNYNIPEALVHIRNALSMRAEHEHSLHLFALLLTANRKPKEALAVIQDALDEFPDNLHLLHLRAHLELYLEDVETALETMQKMFTVWRELYESQVSVTNEHDQNEKHSDSKSAVYQMHTSQLSDKDSNSVHAASLAASRIEHALSEAASSLSSFSPRPGPQKPWMIQLKIWLLLADVYLAIDQPNEAMNCLTEANLIYPMSHQLMYMKGQVHVYLGQWPEAKQCFLNAVSANPYHTDALRALGETHLALGEPRLAEKILKDAAKIDPNCPKIWHVLGEVMDNLEDYTAAADCLATALQLEPTCPILPFTSISLTFE